MATKLNAFVVMWTEPTRVFAGDAAILRNLERWEVARTIQELLPLFDYLTELDKQHGNILHNTSVITPNGMVYRGNEFIDTFVVVIEATIVTELIVATEV